MQLHTGSVYRIGADKWTVWITANNVISALYCLWIEIVFHVEILMWNCSPFISTPISMLPTSLRIPGGEKYIPFRWNVSKESHFTCAWGIALLENLEDYYNDDFLRHFIRITLFHLNNSFALTAIYILNQVANYILKFN